MSYEPRVREKNIRCLSYKIPFIWDRCVKNIRYFFYKISFISDGHKMSLLQDTFPKKMRRKKKKQMSTEHS